MIQVHEFERPRNLYEKLIRDNQRLETEINGDNLFTFISTTVSLQPWIKNSPLSSSETMNRIMKKIVKHPYIKMCKEISISKAVFKIEISDDNNAVMVVGNEKIDVHDFHNEVVELYDNFFKQK